MRVGGLGGGVDRCALPLVGRGNPSSLMPLSYASLRSRERIVFDQSKIDIAKDAIHDVAEELEARAAADIEQRKGAMQKMEPRERPPAPPPNVR
jgi:hypothetical protein